MKKALGFTLVEIIIVVAIVAILAAIAFVAIDPARRLHESRNAKRWADVTAIADALQKWSVDNAGAMYTTLDSVAVDTNYMIGTCDDAADADCDEAEIAVGNCVDLSELGDHYLSKIPNDSSDGTAEKTGYYISKTTDNALTVGSCAPEGEGEGGAEEVDPISVTR
jgi:prepilin-type N-terminal cleavage/methylation domain-containing protein